jgi:hypothetical protein
MREVPAIQFECLGMCHASCLLGSLKIDWICIARWLTVDGFLEEACDLHKLINNVLTRKANAASETETKETTNRSRMSFPTWKAREF